MLTAYQGLWCMHPLSPMDPAPRAQGKGKLHPVHIDSSITHPFLTFFVDGQSQLRQLKRTLTTQQQEPDLRWSFPTPKLSSSFETNTTPEFSQIYFTQASDKHGVFIPEFIVGLESSLDSGTNTIWASDTAWMIRNDGMMKYEKRRKRKLIIFILVIIWTDSFGPTTVPIY